MDGKWEGSGGGLEILEHWDENIVALLSDVVDNIFAGLSIIGFILNRTYFLATIPYKSFHNSIHL